MSDHPDFIVEVSTSPLTFKIWYCGLDSLREPGVVAYFEGCEITDNPEEVGTDARLAWALGFHSASQLAGSVREGLLHGLEYAGTRPRLEEHIP